MLEGLYILDGHTPVRAASIDQWGDFMDIPENKLVARTLLSDRIVSTIFLGIDQNVATGGPPELFQTLGFRKSTINEVVMLGAYGDWVEAERGHLSIVQRLVLELQYQKS